jgi:hypothetical protein
MQACYSARKSSAISIELLSRRNGTNDHGGVADGVVVGLLFCLICARDLSEEAPADCSARNNTLINKKQKLLRLAL